MFTSIWTVRRHTDDRLSVVGCRHRKIESFMFANFIIFSKDFILVVKKRANKIEFLFENALQNMQIVEWARVRLVQPVTCVWKGVDEIWPIPIQVYSLVFSRTIYDVNVLWWLCCIVLCPVAVNMVTTFCESMKFLNANAGQCKGKCRWCGPIMFCKCCQKVWPTFNFIKNYVFGELNFRTFFCQCLIKTTICIVFFALARICIQKIHVFTKCVHQFEQIDWLSDCRRADCRRICWPPKPHKLSGRFPKFKKKKVVGVGRCRPKFVGRPFLNNILCIYYKLRRCTLGNKGGGTGEKRGGTF